MNNNTLRIKIQQRLNKLSSNDYDNIECWQIVEAFNKTQIEWSRRQIRGANKYLDGGERSVIRVDDLQRLLIPEPLSMTNSSKPYAETINQLPDNYLRFKRISCFAKSDCCTNEREMVVYLAEEDNRDILLNDVHKRPSFEWGETFATIITDKIRVYTNNDFTIDEIELTYYRKPINIQILGCKDPYTEQVSTQDIPCEFNDDIVELLIDETVSLIAGDIESGTQFQRGSNSAERNN